MFSGKISIFVAINVIMSADSIIMDTSMTSSWHVSWCCLSACLTFVKGTVPFKMGRIAIFKTLILSTSIISTIDSQVGVIGSSRWVRKWSGRDNDSNSLWFFNSLSKIRPSNGLYVTFNLMSNHLVTFVDLVSLL
jgi:hypothetical protein